MGASGLPALLCGMIGSTLGWAVVPYLDCPVDLGALSGGVETVEDGQAPVRIVPGVRGPGLDGAPEVMRGEETQVFGWLAGHPARLEGRRVVCHPGTHSKWIVIEDGRIVRFLTAMTGELFDVLRRHSVLRSEAAPDDEGAFLKGVAAAGEGDALGARLFTVRSRVVGGDLPPEASASYLSGLLIGAEAASLPGLLGLDPKETLALVGEPRLCGWYERALAARGMKAEVYDGEAAALTGLVALAKGSFQ
jgi:2-dehydro-3-deoxygalactonokinase